MIQASVVFCSFSTGPSKRHFKSSVEVRHSAEFASRTRQQQSATTTECDNNEHRHQSSRDEKTTSRDSYDINCFLGIAVARQSPATRHDVTTAAEVAYLLLQCH